MLACGLAFAGRTENAVYTGGNLDGIAPQAKVTLDLSGDKTIKIRDGQTDVNVPYAGVTKTNVSAADAKDPAAPKHKLSLGKSGHPAQLLTVEFKNAQGDAKTVTLQLTKPAASNVVAVIGKHNRAVQAALKSQPKKSKKDKDADKDDKKEVAKTNADEAVSNKDGSWWGDSVWKTNRNQAKWEQQSGAAAQ
jgi:hypothetical protein